MSEPKPEDNQLQTILKEQDLDGNHAQALLDAFGAPFEDAGKILADYQTIKVTDESDTKSMKEAREKRLALKKTRSFVENKRKELKQNIIKEGRAIDAVATFVKEVIQPAEEYLQLQEDFAKIKEQERLSKLKQERFDALLEYVVNPNLYNFIELSDDEFKELLDKLEKDKEAEIAAQKKAEEERLAKEKAEAEERERMRKENEKLKAEAKKKEEAEAKKTERINILSALGLKWDGEQYVKDDFNVHLTEIISLSDDEFDEVINKINAEIEKRNQAAEQAAAAERAKEEEEKKAQQDKLEKERKAREEAERKIQEAAEAEEKRLAAEAEQKRQLLLGPDKDKLTKLADDIDSLEYPLIKDKSAEKLLFEAKDYLERVSKNLRNKAEELK